MTVTHPFDDLLNFLAHLAPEQVLAFRPSESTIVRVKWLLDQEKSGVITAEEIDELGQYMLQEDSMIIAKARARLPLFQS